MKILVTYEKQDILRLIQADLQSKGLALKAGTTIEYKGAMQAKFSVETDDTVAAPLTAAPPTTPTPTTNPPTTPVFEENATSLGDVLAQSERLVRGAGGKLETRPGPPRRLRAGESLDPPKE